jgi:hypothetical protein
MGAPAIVNAAKLSTRRHAKVTKGTRPPCMGEQAPPPLGEMFAITARKLSVARAHMACNVSNDVGTVVQMNTPSFYLLIPSPPQQHLSPPALLAAMLAHRRACLQRMIKYVEGPPIFLCIRWALSRLYKAQVRLLHS